MTLIEMLNSLRGLFCGSGGASVGDSRARSVGASGCQRAGYVVVSHHGGRHGF